MRVLLISLVALLGCAVDPAVAPRDCTPGQTAACACPGASGVQTCDEGGVLGACLCPDAGSADVVAVADAPAVDAVTPEDRPAPTDVVAVADAPQPDVVDVVTAPDVMTAPDVPRVCPGVDLMRDVMNCGACGNVCEDRPGATRACVMGSCRYACIGSRGDCDGIPSNGCETTTSTSAQHCGACGRACVAPYNACTMGVCIISR